MDKCGLLGLLKSNMSSKYLITTSQWLFERLKSEVPNMLTLKLKLQNVLGSQIWLKLIVGTKIELLNNIFEF